MKKARVTLNQTAVICVSVQQLVDGLNQYFRTGNDDYPDYLVTFYLEKVPQSIYKNKGALAVH